MDTIRVLIADDHQPFRQGLVKLLHSDPGIEVVGEASTGTEAIAKAESLQPDVILMDLKMPGMNGIEAARRILQGNLHMRVLMLTMYEEDESIFSALQVGALGYLLKGALKADILRAVRSVSSGEAIFGPSVAKRLLQHFSSTQHRKPAELFPELTAREQEILELMANHYTNPEIAVRLGISPKTVRNQVSSIFSKLQVADRAQAILRAREAGLGKEHD